MAEIYTLNKYYRECFGQKVYKLSLDGGMSYYDNQNGIGKNHISGLAAGESTKVNVAWIVNEEDLGRMYLEVSGFGASLTGPNVDMAQLVDVRQ